MSLVNNENGAGTMRPDERLKQVSTITEILRRPELGAIA